MHNVCDALLQEWVQDDLEGHGDVGSILLTPRNYIIGLAIPVIDLSTKLRGPSNYGSKVEG